MGRVRTKHILTIGEEGRSRPGGGVVVAGGLIVRSNILPLYRMVTEAKVI
jgi:hypothetical protein